MTRLGRGVRSCVPAVAVKDFGAGRKEGKQTNLSFYRKFFFTTAFLTKFNSEASYHSKTFSILCLLYVTRLHQEADIHISYIFSSAVNTLISM